MGSLWQVIGALLLVASVGLLLTSLVHLRQAWLSRNWPTAEGSITATQVELYESDGSMGADRYEGAIHYRYLVNGQAYTGCWRAPASYDQSEQQHLIEAYPVDHPIVVAYDPHNWSQSTITPGQLQYRDLIFPSILIVIAIALIVTP
jgi:hypothetical protein